MITRATLASVLVAVAASGAACWSTPEDGSSAGAQPPVPLALTTVAWNPSSVDVGTVQAVAESDKSVFVFGSKGVQALTSGAVVSSDDAVTDWRSAVAAPSADGLSTWIVGVDSHGHVLRVPVNGAPDDVSARYGLATDDVQSVVAASSRVAFLVNGGLAMTDGAHVARYKTPARAIAAKGDLVALADGAAVRLFTGDKQSEVALAGVELVAFDGAGVLMAATAHALYRVNGGSVAKVYDAGVRTIHGLVGAGSNVWFIVDGDLGRWHEGQVALATGGALAPDARLAGSASGDVWVVSNGQLLRLASGAGAMSPDEATWTSTVEPVHAAVCSKCHSPSGSGLDSSRIDLSTYSAWSARKPSIYRRVVTNAATPAQMPPPSSGLALTDAQRTAVEAWSKP